MRLTSRPAVYPARVLVLLALALSASLSSAQTYNPLYYFSDWHNGSQPSGQLVMDRAGNLYGSTTYGGTRQCGTAYQLSPPSVAGGAWTETVIRTFLCDADGSGPLGGLTIDNSGNLYGTTAGDGGTPCRCGTVFKLKPPALPGGTWGFRTMHHFAGAPNDGAGPRGPVAADSSGNVYGVTSAGGTYNGNFTGGVAFKLTPAGTGWTESILWNFGGPGDASYILSGLTGDTKGNYYATSLYGGAGGFGSVFQLSPPANGGTAWTETVLYSFPGSNAATGQYPQASVVLDSKGNIFGVAGGRDYSCCGSVFELSPPATGTAWTVKALYTFTRNTNGYMPVGIAKDSTATNLYGITYEDQPLVFGGVVFKLASPGTQSGAWTYSVLHDFYNSGYGLSQSPPLVDSSGKVYGSATGYGGVVFQITP